MWAEFIAEIANSRTSPRGMNCDWLMGDILMGDTSPAEKQTGVSMRWWASDPTREILNDDSALVCLTGRNERNLQQEKV